jgi:hypothetical protein
MDSRARSARSRPLPSLSFAGLGLVLALMPACNRNPTVASAPPLAPAATADSSPPPVPPPPPAVAATAPSSVATTVASLPPLDQLLAPIALYPDPLIALILPSATAPADIQSAAAYLNGGGDPGQVDTQPWSDGVKGLAHYPDVIKWMNDNIAWTQQLGGAFASDPTAVMNAVQDLRARAQTAGTLVSGAQEQVVTNDGAIEIEPAQPDVIYVPRYDPAVVYFGGGPGYYSDSYFYWGNPYPMGIWMSYDFDWRGHAMWRGDWYDYRRDHGGWGRPVVFGQVRFGGAGGPQRWEAPPNAFRGPGFAASASFRGGFAQPRFMPGTPPAPSRVFSAPRPDVRPEREAPRAEPRREEAPPSRREPPAERREPGREERDRRDR